MPPSTPPNVLLVMTDQHRADALGFVGHPLVETPNLDALAARGSVMQNAWTPIPLCMPARSCLMTGRTGSSLGLLDNQIILGPEADTLPNALAKRGYRRAMFGKNHCFTCDALARWDASEVYGIHGKEASASRTPPTDADQAITRWRQNDIPYFESPIHTPQPGRAEDDPAVRQTDEALRFLEADDPEGDRPFFMYLSYEAPHFPYVLPEPYFSRTHPAEMPGPAPRFAGDPARLEAQYFGTGLDRATDDDIRHVQATYLGMIELVDQQIGRVMQALERTGQLGRTLVVFCSDHGDFWGDRGLIGKSTVLYESLLRVPMILAGPGVPASQTMYAAVDLTDLAPTLLDLAGIPASAALPVAQGRSFAGCLHDSKQTHRRYLVAEHAFGRDHGTPREEIRRALERRDELQLQHGEAWFLDLLRGPTISVLDTETNLKWIGHDADRDELYDLSADPDETVNLADDPGWSAQRDRLRGLREGLDLRDADLFQALS
ncbi:MAG: sulfatase-like hydrolase/transferase [Planctomycetota bacterium]